MAKQKRKSEYTRVRPFGHKQIDMFDAVCLT